MAQQAQKRTGSAFGYLINNKPTTAVENASDGATADGAVTGDTTGEITPMVNTGTTAQNTTGQNDPAKNKKLAELKMSEPMRELLNFELTLPGVYPGIKTNQFIWIPVSDTFYDDMYLDLLQEIGASKFNRYADFEEDRFYISRKTWTYDINEGVKTSLIVNPIPSMYSEYMKQQLEAERALDQAIIDAMGGGVGGGSLVQTNGTDTEETATIATHDYNDTSKASHIIGDSNANYAQDTASMSLQQFANIPHKYSYYFNNEVEPQKMWELYRQRGWICGNCADLSRLFKCLCDVHGVACFIYHGPSHYWNRVDVGGGTFKNVDWCTGKSSIGSRWNGGYQTNDAGLGTGAFLGYCRGQHRG